MIMMMPLEGGAPGAEHDDDAGDNDDDTDAAHAADDVRMSRN